MNKKQLIALITALEDSSRIIAKDENISEKMRTKAAAEAFAYASVINLLKSPKLARDIAEIYGVTL